MSEFAWVKVYITKNIAVEIKDDSKEALDLAEQVAYESIDSDDGEVIETSVFAICSKPLERMHETIMIEEYIGEDDE